jgi:hypothetical protein
MNATHSPAGALAQSVMGARIKHAYSGEQSALV